MQEEWEVCIGRPLASRWCLSGVAVTSCSEGLALILSLKFTGLKSVSGVWSLICFLFEGFLFADVFPSPLVLSLAFCDQCPLARTG